MKKGGGGGGGGHREGRGWHREGEGSGWHREGEGRGYAIGKTAASDKCWIGKPIYRATLSNTKKLS